MDKHTLKRLNKVLADNLGRVPAEYGDQARYKWAWTGYGENGRVELGDWVQFGYRESATPSGLIINLPKFELLRQYEDDRWAIAKWEPPMRESEWIARFGTELAWPNRGSYYITSEIMTEGGEPNDAATEYVIGKIKNHLSKSYLDLKNEAEERLRLREQRNENRISDLVDANTFYAIPGVRGGSVSYGGIGENPVLRKKENACQQ